MGEEGRGVSEHRLAGGERQRYVSDDMRERVRKKPCKPSIMCRNEALPAICIMIASNLVGVIVPTIRHPFFATFTAHLQHALAAQGLRTMLCSTADEADGEIQYVDMLRRHMMDGIVNMCAHFASRRLLDVDSSPDRRVRPCAWRRYFVNRIRPRAGVGD